MDEQIKLNRAQRRALLRKDKTSGTSNRTKGGARMRARVKHRLDQKARGTAKINAFLSRAFR